MRKTLSTIVASLLSAMIPIVAEDFETAGRADVVEEDVIRTQTALFELGAGASLKGDYLPFYLYANRHGILSPSGGQSFNRAFYKYRVDSEQYGFEVGGDLYFYHRNEAIYYSHHLHLQQLYVKGNWGRYALQLGSKEEAGEFVPELSSGNMLWSGNSRPAPTLRFGLDDFIPTFITGNLFEVKFNLWWSKQTDGRVNREIYERYEERYAQDGHHSIYWDNITDNRQHAKVENAWMHRKSLFLRTSTRYPLYVTFGLEHGVLYGGTVNGVDCSGATNWIRSILGASGKEDGNGFNHALTQNYRMDWRSDKFHVGVYKQHYADDMEGGLFSNGADGLWGVEIRLPKQDWVRNIVVEYLHTTNQGGVVYANDIYTKDGSNRVYRTAGNSNFYHDQHMGSWTHYGMILGNPLLASPLYNQDFYPDMASNMIRAFHLAFSGNISYNLNYVVKVQHTDSWGTPFAPFGEIRSNNSFGIETVYRWNEDWTFRGGIAVDRGSLYGDNTGLNLNIQYKL